MNIPSGMAKTIHTAVTATAIASVLIEVDKYAGTVKMFTKFSSVNPGITLEVNGSITQKAVTNKSASEMMYTPTSQVIGSARSAISLVVGLL
jgi:hypothetical protein